MLIRRRSWHDPVRTSISTRPPVSAYAIILLPCSAPGPDRFPQLHDIRRYKSAVSPGHVINKNKGSGWRARLTARANRPFALRLTLFVWLWFIVNDCKFLVEIVFFSHTNQSTVLLYESATIRTSQPNKLSPYKSSVSTNNLQLQKVRQNSTRICQSSIGPENSGLMKRSTSYIYFTILVYINLCSYTHTQIRS